MRMKQIILYMKIKWLCKIRKERAAALEGIERILVDPGVNIVL